MNILIFNTYNPNQASGIVALDLFNELRQKGHNVKLLVNRYDPTYPEGILSMETYLMSLKRAILYKFKWRYEKLRSELKFREKLKADPNYRIFKLKERTLIYKTCSLIRKANIIPDAIIVLFADKFINVKNIYELHESTGAPVYWLMYDMAPLTGGCHYSWNCSGYQINCGNCPGLFSKDPYDLTYENLLYKRSFISKTYIEIIAGSERQYKQAKESSLFKNNVIHKVFLSVDSNIFRPVDKNRLRQNLNIPSNKKILFFGSVGLSEKRKGMHYLIESLKVLKQEANYTHSDLKNEIMLLIAGKEIEQIIDYLPFDYHYMGMVNNTSGIASGYQAADLFVCPSIEDSGPMMINQSLMCGTPVVSFEMGVASDLVIPGITGYRAKLKDINDMAQGIMNILKLDKNEYKNMSDRCRELALKLFSPQVQIDKIESIISNQDYKASFSKLK